MTETGSWDNAAARLGVKPDHLVQVLANRREPSKRLLAALKIKKIVMYEDQW